MTEPERPLTVGYLGPPGTFSEEAAIRYFKDTPTDLRPLLTIASVTEHVQSGAVTCGIVPIENTLEGTIRTTVDSLAEQPHVQIQGEIRLAISQCLLGLEGAELAEIHEVWSIPPALAQCQRIVKQIGASTKAHPSTASAAWAVKQSGRTDVAAIASALAAKQIGLQVLAHDIQDVAANQTRFVVIAKNPDVPAQANRMMLLIQSASPTDASPLPKVMHTLSARGFRLIWLEVRPTKHQLGTYRYYLEVEPPSPLPSDMTAESGALVAELQRVGVVVRLLGIYQAST